MEKIKLKFFLTKVVDFWLIFLFFCFIVSQKNILEQLIDALQIVPRVHDFKTRAMVNIEQSTCLLSASPAFVELQYAM